MKISMVGLQFQGWWRKQKGFYIKCDLFKIKRKTLFKKTPFDFFCFSVITHYFNLFIIINHHNNEVTDHRSTLKAKTWD